VPKVRHKNVNTNHPAWCKARKPRKGRRSDDRVLMAIIWEVIGAKLIIFRLRGTIVSVSRVKRHGGFKGE